MNPEETDMEPIRQEFETIWKTTIKPAIQNLNGPKQINWGLMRSICWLAFCEGKGMRK